MRDRRTFDLGRLRVDVEVQTTTNEAHTLLSDAEGRREFFDHLRLAIGDAAAAALEWLAQAAQASPPCPTTETPSVPPIVAPEPVQAATAPVWRWIVCDGCNLPLGRVPLDATGVYRLSNAEWNTVLRPTIVEGLGPLCPRCDSVGRVRLDADAAVGR